MKTLTIAAIRCSLMFLVSAVAAALTHLSALAQRKTSLEARRAGSAGRATANQYAPGGCRSLRHRGFREHVVGI